MRLLFYSGLIFLLVNPILAQDVDFKRLSWEVAYFGNDGLNPGGIISSDFAILHAERRRNVVHRRNAEITNVRHHALNINLSFTDFNIAGDFNIASFTGGLSYKTIAGSRFVYEIGGNIGYSRSFLNKNYSFLSNQDDGKFPIPGAFFLTNHYYFNFGKFLKRPLFFIKGWNTGFHILRLYEFNGINTNFYNIKLGIILR